MEVAKRYFGSLAYLVFSSSVTQSSVLQFLFDALSPSCYIK